MVVDVVRNTIAHHTFRDLPNFLRPGDALVLNETKVLPARLQPEADRRPGGASLPQGPGAGSGRRVGSPGQAEQTPQAKSGALRRRGSVEVAKSLGDGHWVVSGPDVPGLLQRSGRMPLPPYIRPTPRRRAATRPSTRATKVPPPRQRPASTLQRGFWKARSGPEPGSAGSRCTSG